MPISLVPKPKTISLVDDEQPSFLESVNLPASTTQSPAFRAGLKGRQPPDKPTSSYDFIANLLDIPFTGTKPDVQGKPLLQSPRQKNRQQLEREDRAVRGLTPLPGQEPLSVAEVMINRTQRKREAFNTKIAPFLK